MTLWASMVKRLVLVLVSAVSVSMLLLPRKTFIYA